MGTPEIVGIIVGIVGTAMTFLAFVASVIYKFARADSRSEQTEKRLEKLEAHVEDYEIHHDARSFAEYREATNRRFDEQKQQMNRMDSKLDILLGVQR